MKLTPNERLILELIGCSPTEEELLRLAEESDLSPDEFIRAAGVYILHRDSEPQAS